MRQVIVVATDAAINVFTDEHGVTTQIATIINTGTLEVPDLVQLGGGLVDALHLNGAEPSPPPASPRALPPATMPKRRKPSRAHDRRAPSIDDILAFVREHDGCTTTEIARALVPVPLGNTQPVQMINNRLLGYRARCVKQGVPQLIRSGGGTPAHHHWIGP